MVRILNMKNDRLSDQLVISTYGVSYQLQGISLFSCPPVMFVKEGYPMTMREDSRNQASALMLELNDATSAMMGMVGSHQTTGPIWEAAAMRQSRSFGRWNTFLRESDIYSHVLN